MARQSIAFGLLALCAGSAAAATLHGRVKDQQCAVLSNVAVRIRATDTSRGYDERTLKTDSSGNYTAELSAGTYEVCVKQGTAGGTCTNIDMPSAGDKWMTTQLRDAASDLSTLGNRSY